MYNTILRKITSLSLLAILLTSSGAFIAPNAIPQAHAALNANLFVSAENPQFNNYFAGPQVIEVVVNDNDIKRLDNKLGEPDVTVSGKKLRMLQATDGNWYGYFADRTMAQRADKTQNFTGGTGAATSIAGYSSGKGLDFGKFCDRTTTTLGVTISVTDTVGIAIARNATAASYGGGAVTTANGFDGTTISLATPTCAATPTTAPRGPTIGGIVNSPYMHVIRQNKTLNNGVAGTVPVGQIGIRDSNLWPFIQLYDLPQQGKVVVNYNKGGGTQSVVLTFDRIPSSMVSAKFDKATYTLNSQTFITITDPQLNIDPTDEDTWTWDTSFVGLTATGNNRLYYESYTRNGVNDLGNATKPQNIIGNFTGFNGFMGDRNGFFTINPDAQSVGATLAPASNIVVAQTNQKFRAATVDENGVAMANWQLGARSDVSFVETDPKTGTFRNWDDGQISNLVTTGSFVRGASATLRYNDVSQSAVTGFGFGTLTMGPVEGEWNSGEKIPVTLVDTDENLNSKILEHMDVQNTFATLIPTLRIGTPFTLSPGTDAYAVYTTLTFSTPAQTLNYLGGGNRTITAATALGGPGTGNAVTPSNPGTDPFTFRTFLSFTRAAAAPTFTLAPASALVIDLSALTYPAGAVAGAATTGMSRSSTNLISPVGATTGTIHDTRQTISTPGSSRGPVFVLPAQRFHGFNFINYDISSLNKNATASLTNIEILLIVNQTTTNSAVGANSVFPPARALGGAADPIIGAQSISLANTTSLKGTINLNGTTATSNNAAGTNIGVTAAAALNQINGLFNRNNTCTIVTPLLAGTACTTATKSIALAFVNRGPTATLSTGVVNGLRADMKPIVADFFSFGLIGDGDQESQRINNAIYRLELEESGTDTSTFTGTIEYLMLNQLSMLAAPTYAQIRAVNHEVKFVAHEDLIQADNRAVRINYFDLGSDGVNTPIASQQDAPTHSGVVSFDNKNYKIGDTVTIKLADQDLNVDNDLIDIYTTVPTLSLDVAADTIGVAGLHTTTTGTAFGRLLDVQFGQANFRWQGLACPGMNALGTLTNFGYPNGLSNTGFTLVESSRNSGEFAGTFQVPDVICPGPSLVPPFETAVASNGLNIKVNYVDFRDASGKTIEVSDRAGVRGNTGSVKLDRTVYPVPFGELINFNTITGTQNTPGGRSVFPLHKTGIAGALNNAGTVGVEEVGLGDALVHIRVNDRDFDQSAAGQDRIASNSTLDGSHTVPPVKVTVTRGSNQITLATLGGPVTLPGPIGVGAAFNASNVRSLGPMNEIAPDAGIFQGDLQIHWTDGPPDTACPSTTLSLTTTASRFPTTIATPTGAITDRFSVAPPAGQNYCIIQGDILTVQYTDPTDASGNINTVTDSASFDLRNGVLQSDKSVYIIGSDMILTLIEPDFNLDSQAAETKSLDLIEWDSHAAKVVMGQNGRNTANFDAKPADFRETGKDTGIFQSVIRIPKQLSTIGGVGGTLLERGEQIHLEYTDWGPAGANTVGDEDQDIKLTIYTSNFGATVELDQKVFTWTDKAYITVVAPDHNFDSNLIDTIGDTDQTKVTVATRGQKLVPFRLTETGVDTGIFTGEITLTGFPAATPKVGGVDEAGNNPSGIKSTCTPFCGPTTAFLPSQDSDGITVSFLYTKDQTVTGSALIRWNIGEVQWVEASYPANGQGVLRIIDPDMNLNPESVDKFDTNVWSDSDAGGIKLTMTETNEATGIFEGTVYFTTQFTSSGNRLKVNEGDTVTGEYLDKTLPAPYTTADQLRITGTTFIGTIVPPLERAPATNPRVVDAFGNELTEVKVDQQIQITADLANGQDRTQPFAYLVQIQDSNGVTVSLSWITGSLTAGQSLNPAQSWTASAAGTYTAQIFVWESVDNPNALSPPAATTITVV